MLREREKKKIGEDRGDGESGEGKREEIGERKGREVEEEGRG